jgi:hypothetical protein
MKPPRFTQVGQPMTPQDRRDADCLFAAVALVYFTLYVLAAAVAVVVILGRA